MNNDNGDVSYLDFFDLDKSGRMMQTIHNCLEILERAPRFRDAIRLNLFTGTTDVSGSPGWSRQGSQLTDTDMCNIMLYMEEYFGLNNERKIEKAVRIYANEHAYHPVCEYLSKLEWDGTERIRHALPHFLGCDRNDFTYEALKLFMMGALSRIYDPGCKFEYMLCLVGGQGAGKSTFFRFLAAKDEWFSDDIRRLDDENIYRKLQGHWIIEMSEMLGVGSARNVEEIKSFLSRQKDNYKVPYEIHPQDRLRQCVFGGTSNALDFLPLDRTGNRRFIPIMVHPEQAEVHILEDEKASRAYIDQMWAEAMTMYRDHDYKLTLSKEMREYLKNMQQDFMPEDTKLGMIQEFLDTCGRDMVCSKMLFAEALCRGSEQPKQWEIREINDIMNNSVTGWTMFNNPKVFAGYGRQKGWKKINISADEEVQPAGATGSENQQITVNDNPYPFE